MSGCIKNILCAIVVVSFTEVFATAAQARLTKDDIYTLATDAKSAFQQANELAASEPGRAEALYDKAILRLEKIIADGGVANAHLYYNIGNAYLLKNDIGQAILNYRRSQKLGGNSADLVKNLAYARGRRLDKIGVTTKKRLLKTLFFWHYDFAARMRFILGGTFWAIACVTGGVALWSSRRRRLMWVALVCLFVGLCFCASVAVESLQSTRQGAGVIIAAEVTARQGDAENYPQSFKEPLHEGTEFGLLEKRGGWLRIELADMTETWIPASAAELI